MHSGFVALLLACSLLLVSACASNSSPRMRGVELDLRYATVTGVERVDMPSAAPAGAIVGGFTGLILSRNKSTRSQVASGVGGAALGALATRALEGDNRGWGYTLRYRNGDEGRFISEKSWLRRGDCVIVEKGQYANVRRVEQRHCTGVAPPPDQHIADATQCTLAKQQLLDAASKEALDNAARKVELLCRSRP